MNEGSPNIIALLHGNDQRGIVWKVSGWIYERGGNIIHADQHRDAPANIFFQRVEWHAGERDPTEEMEAFAQFASESLGMQVQVSLANHRPNIAIFVSKIEHCFHDLLVRWKMEELPCQIACVISNHATLAAESRRYAIPFHHIPVTEANREQAENEQLRILRANRVDLVVLARYMQILSESYLEKLQVPVINIHHSFLPAFAGAKPYHQAHRRGVKIIGATAHYATPVLDDGPIISQAVAPVNHRHSVSDLVRTGRDLEKTVLAQAVSRHLEHRVLVYNNKTVVFD